MNRIKLAFAAFWIALRKGSVVEVLTYFERRNIMREEVLTGQPTRKESAEQRLALVHDFYKLWCERVGVPWEGADGVDPAIGGEDLAEFSIVLGYHQDWAA